MTRRLPFFAVFFAVVLFVASTLPTAVAAQEFAQQQQKLQGQGLVNERFGNDVAIDSGYIAVGAPNALNAAMEEESGRVFVFHDSGGTWTPVLLNFAGAANENFGWAVAIDGTYLVGTSLTSTAGPATTGRARVLHRTGDATMWDAGVDLAPAAPAAALQFGNAVAIDGDYIIVGAFGSGGVGEELSGAAYIFRRTGTNTWDSGVLLTSPNLEVGGRFGYNVDIDGDYAIVGAPMEGTSGNAYVFQRTGPDNAWDSGTPLNATAVMMGEGFGTAVAISGDVAIVGASPSDMNGSSAGDLYAFQRSGPNTWAAGVPLVVNGDPDGIGRAVALSGNLAVAGAQFANFTGDETGTGNTIRLNDPAGFTWDDGQLFAAEDFSGMSNFGFEVDIDGTAIVVGAYADDAVMADAGSVYVFNVGASAIQTTPASVDFGDVALGVESRITLTYTNASSDSESLFQVVLGGLDFTVEAASSSPCDVLNPTVLPAGASCNVDIVFQPAFEGAAQDTLLGTWSFTYPDIMTEVTGTGVMPVAVDGGPMDGGMADAGPMDGDTMLPGDPAVPGDPGIAGDPHVAGDPNGGGDTAMAGDSIGGSPKKGCGSLSPSGWWIALPFFAGWLRRRRSAP